MLYSREKWNGLFQELRGEAEVLRYAEQAMGKGQYTITRKKHTLPKGGTANDYVSIGPYWWPDPEKADGLPWIRRDGEVNPVFYEYDSETLFDFVTDVGALLLGGLSNGRQDWLDKATQQIEGWFITPETKMNPDLRYAQFVPGRAEGRCFGIIDVKELYWLFELLEMLPFTENWTREKLDAVKAWSGDMGQWLLNHQLGIEEGNTLNNHAISYDCMVAMMALFAGQQDIALRQIRDRAIPRIPQQFAENGSLPLELERTDSKGYSVFCLYCFFQAGCLAKNMGIDFPDTMLRKGLAWLENNVESPNWMWAQILPFNKSSMAILYDFAGEFLNDPTLVAQAKSLAAHPWSYMLYWRRDR